MTTQTNEIKKLSIGNYLNFPATDKFLKDNLQENRKEFVSNLLALCDADPALAECEPQKLMLCAMNATALNLPLNKNLGYAYIIPYKGIPQFQIGYKGLIQLALRTAQYEILNATEIRAGEIKRNKVTGEITILNENATGPVIGYLAYLRLRSGFSASLYMTVDEIEAHALRFSSAYKYDKSQNKRSSKWSDPEARPKMALKTVLKGLLGTYGILSPEMVQAISSDDDEADSVRNNVRDVSDANIIDQKEPDGKPEEAPEEKSEKKEKTGEAQKKIEI